MAPHGDPGPNYGSQKVYVGIQLKSDGTYPADASLNGANVHYVITALDGSSREGDCTPVQDSAATATCPSTFFEGTVLLAPGETGVFTQTMAPLGPGVLTDPDSNTVGPCVVGTGSTDPVTGLPYCGVSPFVAGAPTPQSVTPALGGRAVTFVDPGVPPVAEPDTATVTTGHSTDIYVTANDSSGYAEGPEVTVTLITPPSHGTATGDGYPVRYTPTPGFGGLDSFRYRLDAPNGSSTATVTITVKAPPIATNNAAVTVGGDGTAGQTVTIPVLANDSANGGGPLTLAAVGNPPHGSAVIRGANVLYTPDAGFVGTDLFSCTIRTANGTATATIRVAVTAPVVAAAVSSDQLASTGAASEQLLGLGSLLLLVGGGATVVGRRRRMDA